MLMLGASFDINYVLRAIFPVITCRHNYVTTFIFLYLFTPYLNVLVKNLSKHSLEKLLLLAVVIFSIMPTFMEIVGLWTNNVYSYLLWMMFLYCIGAYLQLHGEWKALPWRWICLVTFITYIIIIVYGPSINPLIGRIFSGSINNIFLVILSVFVFMGFAACEISYSKVINWFASSTFAVLLIHDDPLVRNVIWTKVFKNAQYAESNYLWLHAICSVVLTYMGCVLIDKIYKYLLKEPLRRGICHFRTGLKS